MKVLSGSVSCLLALLIGVAEAQEGGARVEALEQRLSSAESVELYFEVTAEGSVTAAISGRLGIERGGLVELTAWGSFAGQPVLLGLAAEQETLYLGNAAATAPGFASMARPAELEEALVIGLTRMGILHNVARLTTAAAPDHAEGGVRDWVTLKDFEGTDRVSFALTVAGEPAGTAALELDGGGLPLRREQRVAFPEGEMRVVERYARVTVSP